jgi:hypothetical protein
VLDDDPAPGRRDQGGVAVSVDRGRRVARHLSLRGAEGEGIGSRCESPERAGMIRTDAAADGSGSLPSASQRLEFGRGIARTLINWAGLDPVGPEHCWWNELLQLGTGSGKASSAQQPTHAVASIHPPPHRTVFL